MVRSSIWVISSWGSLPSGREVAGRPLPPWPTPEQSLFKLFYIEWKVSVTFFGQILLCKCWWICSQEAATFGFVMHQTVQGWCREIQEALHSVKMQDRYCEQMHEVLGNWQYATGRLVLQGNANPNVNCKADCWMEMGLKNSGWGQGHVQPRMPIVTIHPVWGNIVIKSTHSW